MRKQCTIVRYIYLSKYIFLYSLSMICIEEVIFCKKLNVIEPLDVVFVKHFNDTICCFSKNRYEAARAARHRQMIRDKLFYGRSCRD